MGVAFFSAKIVHHRPEEKTNKEVDDVLAQDYLSDEWEIEKANFRNPQKSQREPGINDSRDSVRA